MGRHEWNSPLSGSEFTEFKIILSTYAITSESQQAGKVRIGTDDVVVQLKFKSTAFGRADQEREKEPKFDCWGFQAPWYVFKGLLKSSKFSSVVDSATYLADKAKEEGLGQADERSKRGRDEEEEEDSEVEEVADIDEEAPLGISPEVGTPSRKRHRK